MDPVRAPVAVGVNVTLIVQVIPAGTDAPHVFVSAKSPEPVIEVIFSTRLPLFFSVIVLAGELVVVTSWLPKSRLVGITTEFIPLAERAPDLQFILNSGYSVAKPMDLVLDLIK